MYIRPSYFLNKFNNTKYNICACRSPARVSDLRAHLNSLRRPSKIECNINHRIDLHDENVFSARGNRFPSVLRAILYGNAFEYTYICKVNKIERLNVNVISTAHARIYK